MNRLTRYTSTAAELYAVKNAFPHKLVDSRFAKPEDVARFLDCIQLHPNRRRSIHIRLHKIRGHSLPSTATSEQKCLRKLQIVTS